MNIIEKMKEYKLFDLNWENSYAERFNKILNKYRNGLNNNNENEETINYYKTDKYRDSNTENNINKNLSNINYKSKQNVKSFNNEQTFNREQSQIDIENDDNYFKNILLMNRLPSLYDKIKISNIKMIKMGKLRVKKISSNNNYYNENKNNKNDKNDLLYPNEFEVKSENNNIRTDMLENNKLLKTRTNIKRKYNISPLLINTDNNEIIIQEPMVLSQSNLEMCKLNLVLKKQVNEKETNDLIKKIYQFEEDNTSFNKNEINKIGIMLLNYIRLEKKCESIEANFFIYKDKLNKMKEKMQILSTKALNRIKDSNSFIKQLNNKN